MNVKLWLAAIALTLAAPPVYAHHSAAMFDRNKTVEVLGTVKAWEWTNPHCWLLMIVEKDGKPVEYNIESAAVNLLIRRGWTPTSVAPGEKLQVRYHPLKDGKVGGELVAVIKTNGVRIDTLAPGSN